VKKIIPILVVGIFILSALSATALLETKTSTSSRDELDQSQTVMTENAALPVGQVPIPDNITYFQVAQSFIPAKEVLTRVELYIGKNSTATYPYVLAVRANLTGEDMTLTSVDPEDVVTEDFGWVEFNFDDVTTTIGQTYYIVSYTENVTDNFYAWGANNESDSYPFGCAWMSIDDGDTWSNDSASSNPNSAKSCAHQGKQTRLDDPGTWDMCFKTYGKDNLPPEAPSITGETNGNTGTEYEYTFAAVDPDGDDIAEYIVDWGDETGENITGPFASGAEATASHTWDEDGDYTITAKAKDINGLVGPEGTLPITMPVNQQVSPNQSIRMQIMQRIIQHFPLVQRLLGI